MKWTIAFVSYQALVMVASARLTILGCQTELLLIAPHLTTMLIGGYLGFKSRSIRKISGVMTMFATVRCPPVRESLRRPWVWIPHMPDGDHVTADEVRQTKREMLQLCIGCMSAFVMLCAWSLLHFAADCLS